MISKAINGISINGNEYLLNNDMIDSIIKQCDKLLKAGCVDIDHYMDKEYLLPKMILSVVLQERVNNFSRLFDKSNRVKQDVKNLKHF